MRKKEKRERKENERERKINMCGGPQHQACLPLRQSLGTSNLPGPPRWSTIPKGSPFNQLSGFRDLPVHPWMRSHHEQAELAGARRSPRLSCSRPGSPEGKLVIRYHTAWKSRPLNGERVCSKTAPYQSSKFTQG